MPLPDRAKAAADENLDQCKYCERHFNALSLAKHQSICLKVFGSKRKVFESKLQRMPEVKVEKTNSRAKLRSKNQLDLKKLIKKLTSKKESLELCLYCCRRFKQDAIEKHKQTCQSNSKIRYIKKHFGNINQI
jgi:hypothetical protein